MKIRIAASTFTKPFHPLLNALPIDGFSAGVSFVTTGVATGSGLSVNCTRKVASDTRSLMARFIAVYCSTSVSRSVSWLSRLRI
jgi:hypothetical protein